MTTYFFEIKQCPACETQFSCMQVGSCNTFGAKFYTDGYVDGSMYDEPTVVAPCRNCEQVLWLDDLPTLEVLQDPYRIVGADGNRISEAHRFQPEDFESLLSERNWNNEVQETYVRIRAWWAASHKYRKLDDEDFTLSTEQRENLKQLLNLLSDDDPNDVIMRAEVLRQLGRFEECLATLGVRKEERYQGVVGIIQRLAIDRCVAVKEVVLEA